MNRLPSKLQAVMFDWAGTTVDFGSRAPTRVFVTIFERKGVPITEAEARGPMGRAKRDHIATILALPRVAEAWTVRHGQTPRDADIDLLYTEFLPLQEEVLADHADLIPGALETLAECRRRGLKIGGSTGYTRDLMNILEPLAKSQGYAPDVSMCADDTLSGRPAPWMIFRAAERLGVYPMSALVAVDDTPVGIEAGRNAGAWTVGVTKTGNGIGLSPAALESLDKSDLEARMEKVSADLIHAGAHFVIEGVADLIPILDEIENRLKAGRGPDSV